MKREEAITELNVLHERLSNPKDCEDGCYSWEDGWYVEAVDMAIEALSVDVVSREHFDVLKKNYDMQAKLLKEEHAKAVGVERPHGRWIEAKMDYGECSECGFYGLITDYCPNCGALMMGDD